MTQKELILKSVKKKDDKLFISKVLDKVFKAESTRNITHTEFMDPYKKSMIVKALSKYSNIHYYFEGGYVGAEREAAVFRPDSMSLDIDVNSLFRLLKIQLRCSIEKSHRDYLGALLGLGIKREKVGDILVREMGCDIIVMNEIAEFLKYNLIKVGNIKVDANICNLNQIESQKTNGKEISATTASMRLDCVSSTGFGLSRNKSASIIKSEKLYLNWEMVSDIKKQVKEGDTITIRGKGRIVLEKINGITRKGRIGIIIKRFD